MEPDNRDELRVLERRGGDCGEPPEPAVPYPACAASCRLVRCLAARLEQECPTAH